jgi:thiol-disulfide isomerase/thioredoxin
MENKIFKLTKKRIIISILIVIFILLTFFIVSIFENKSTTLLKNRQNYVIEEVTNKFLSNYLTEDKNLIIFSASWCKYCVEEQDELDKFIKSNPTKNIIIVSHDHNKSDLENYLTKNNLNWFTIFDKDKTIRENIDPGSKGIPSAYLLDKNGKILNTHNGKMDFQQFTDFFNQIKIY